MTHNEELAGNVHEHRPMSPAQWHGMMMHVAGGDRRGEATFFSGGPDTAHLHVYRFGPCPSLARTVVYNHSEETGGALVFLDAAQTRQLAAALLNVADELEAGE